MRRLRLASTADLEPAAVAVASVRAEGGVVLLPTETFYGLGADPEQDGAVARVFALKGRPESWALPVLCAGWEQVERLAVVAERWRGPLAAHWPGAVTAVLPARRPLPAGSGSTVAVRIPGHALLRAVLDRVGPLTGTSANRHGQRPHRRADAALASLAGSPELLLDGGTTPGGAASTLVDLCGGVALVVRQGRVAWA